MEMKEEALQLAKYLDRLNGYMDMPRDILDITQPSSAMIRRLVEELDRLDYDLKSLAKRYKALDKTKPLSDEEIISMFDHPDDFNCIDFARAIEERHGIK